MLTIRFLKMRADPFDPSPIDIALTDGARGQMASGRVGNELGFDLIVLQRAEELIGLRHCTRVSPVLESRRVGVRMAAALVSGDSLRNAASRLPVQGDPVMAW